MSTPIAMDRAASLRTMLSSRSSGGLSIAS
jgi:hypothetical protein